MVCIDGPWETAKEEARRLSLAAEIAAKAVAAGRGRRLLTHNTFSLSTTQGSTEGKIRAFLLVADGLKQTRRVKAPLNVVV